jgi:hypothetical protein
MNQPDDQLIEKVKHAYPTKPDAQFTGEVMSKLTPQPKPQRARLIAVTALLSAAASSVVTLNVINRGHETFAARGEQASEGFSAKYVGVETNRDTNNTFTFRVYNRSRLDLELMIFAVDNSGEAHWFYPAYTDAATNPRSKSILAGRPVFELEDAVVPDFGFEETVTVVSIFSERPLAVRDVEKQLQRGMSALQESYPDAVISFDEMDGVR